MPEGAAPVRSPGQTTIRHHLVATFGRISLPLAAWVEGRVSCVGLL